MIWLTGDVLVLINEVALRQSRLVPGCVTVLGWVNRLGAEVAVEVYTQPGCLSMGKREEHR